MLSRTIQLEMLLGSARPVLSVHLLLFVDIILPLRVGGSSFAELDRISHQSARLLNE